MKIKNKRLFKRIFASVMVLLLTFSIGLPAAASMYEPEKKGSFTLTIQETVSETEVKAISGVALKLYKVGNAVKKNGTVQFELDEALSATGVDLGDLTTAEKSVKAAEILATAVGSSSIVPQDGISGEDGKVSFTNLEQGMYLIVEGDPYSHIDVAPMLLSLPYMVDATNWLYDVQAYPKTVVNDNNGTLVVTKKLYKINDDFQMVPIFTEDETFTVGLFLDREGTIPYGKDYKKEIHIVGTDSGTVTFTGLMNGTYYLYELNADGSSIPVGTVVAEEGDFSRVCMITDETGSETNRVEIAIPENGSKALTVNNCYYYLPDHYGMKGKIHITKKVVKEEKEIEVDETFYAGVFAKDETGEFSLVDVVELKQGEAVEVEVEADVQNGAIAETEFKVLETDKDGKPVDKKEFAYEVSGEGTVTISEAKQKQDITITNTVKDEKDEINKTTATKTGDETPIIPYMILLVLSGAIAVVLFIIKPGRR